MDWVAKWIQIFCIFTLGFAACGAAAESSTPSNHSYLEPLSAPDSKAGAPSFLDSASIQAGTSDTKVSIALDGFIPNFIPKTDYLHYQLGGDAPVSKGSTADIDIGTLSGLTAGASANAQLTAILWPKGDSGTDFEFLAFCEKAIEALIPGYNWKMIAAANSDPQCAGSFLTKENLVRVVKELNAAIEDCKKLKDERKLGLTETACTVLAGAAKPAELVPDAQDERYLEQLGSEKLAEYERNSKPLTLLTLGAKVNRQNISYFGEGKFAELDKKRATGYGASLLVSRIDGNVMYSGGFSYEKSYKAGASVEYCTPLSGSSSSQCLTGTSKQPTKAFARIASLETRLLLKTNAFAVAPRIEYDFTASNYAVKLPIYVAPNKEKALIGGIALGYTDRDGEGFGASIFIGKAFSLFD